MPVRNGAGLVVDAVRSILAQEFRDFELVMIDDGSTDGTGERVRALGDPRVRIIRNETSQGISRALNRGMDAARGRLLARMDGDDLALPGRLARQVEFLDAHPEVSVVGSWVRFFGGIRREVLRNPTEHAAIRAKLVVGNALVHPSVMLRLDELRRLGLKYDPAFDRAEDYELWSRALGSLRAANLPEVLLRYRRHLGQVGSQHGEEQVQVAMRVRQRILEGMGIQAGPEEFRLHRWICQGPEAADPGWVPASQRVTEWCETLLRRASSVPELDRDALRFELSRHVTRSTILSRRRAAGRKLLGSNPFFARQALSCSERMTLHLKRELGR